MKSIANFFDFKDSGGIKMLTIEEMLNKEETLTKTYSWNGNDGYGRKQKIFLYITNKNILYIEETDGIQDIQKINISMIHNIYVNSLYTHISINILRSGSKSYICDLVIGDSKLGEEIAKSLLSLI